MTIMDSSARRRQFNDIDEYIATFPKDIQGKLEGMRSAIKEAAPEAEEVISYGMPAFKMNRVLVYFAAFKSHIGFYPMASGISAFKDELSRYKQSKGAVQFPIEEVVPLDLVRRMVKFRVEEDMAKAKKRKGR
jgi:uncharacterized protein YdhG (YjbR/CyaY superfamily)